MFFRRDMNEQKTIIFTQFAMRMTVIDGVMAIPMVDLVHFVRDSRLYVLRLIAIYDTRFHDLEFGDICVRHESQLYVTVEGIRKLGYMSDLLGWVAVYKRLRAIYIQFMDEERIKA